MSATRRHAELAENLWLYDLESTDLEDEEEPTELYELMAKSKQFLIIFGLGPKLLRHQSKIIDYYNSLCAHADKNRQINLFVCT